MAKVRKVTQAAKPPASKPAGLGIVTPRPSRAAREQSGKPRSAKRSKSRTRQIAGIALWSVALTVVLYLLAYYLLPPPPPSAAVVSLLAFVAVMITHVAGGALRGRRSAGGE